MLIPRKHQHREGPVCWHFNSCETLAKYLTCFPHYSSSSQSCPSCFSAFILRVREGKCGVIFTMCPRGPNSRALNGEGGHTSPSNSRSLHFTQPVNYSTFDNHFLITQASLWLMQKDPEGRPACPCCQIYL